ncbi:MAG: hypothetical protein GF353_23305 [Candidatus Lokiarchaeota archaeon]|nr:hypothetical protein [Candidatus Lokiarchaeota archaeon]
MTGIFAILKFKKLKKKQNEFLVKLSSKIKHRGIKEKTHLKKFPLELIVYHNYRDEESKNLFSTKTDLKKKIIVVDGNTFYMEENENMNPNNNKNQKSRYQILNYILKNYNAKNSSIFNKIQGTFSGVIYNGEELIGFKDPIGAKPLYYCCNENFIIFSSELKAIAALEEDIFPIPPGCIVSSSGYTKKFYNYPEFTSISESKANNTHYLIKELRKKVIAAIKRNVNEEEKISGLLSGGIDSTIITHIAKDFIDDFTVYTVGVEDSEDLYYATKYAKTYGLRHEILTISLDDILKVLPEVIYSLESFDAALIRSSVPMFLISQKIKTIDNADVLLTGEGGDELFGGYEYLNEYETEDKLNNEIINLLNIEYLTGLQRVDRIPYYFSIEARAPLFERNLVELSFRIPNKLKICKRNSDIIEKWILRKAFENDIPSEYLWRKKRKFSDGAGSQFLLREYIETKITDTEFHKEKKISPKLNLRSKEELFYWRIFDSKFNPTELTVLNLGFTAFFEI